MEADSRYDERQIALAPYLERLAMPDEETPRQPAIALDPWEQSALQEALGQDHANGARWPALLAESVAFQTKCMSEAEEMEREEYTSPESMEQHRERLTINAAIGLALMEEIQRVIDATVLAGKMGEAKRLTGFRHKLAQVVKEIKENISREEYEEAELVHHKMLAPQEKLGQEQAAPLPMLDIQANEANQPRPAALREPDEGPPKAIKMNRCSGLKLGHAVEVKPDYSKRLLLLLGATLLAWAILVLPRMLSEPLPVLTMPDLPHSTAIQEVIARPPSLYIVVNQSGWNELTSQERLQWVEEVGKAALAAGYTGVSVQTGEGASVAQWLKEKGTRLLTRSEAGS